MMPNVTRGGYMAGLIMYLQGAGRANEHTHPHVVAGHDVILELAGDGELSTDMALDVVNALELPSKIFGTKIMVPVMTCDEETGQMVPTGEKRDGHVWHCSLSLKADEGELSDEKWQQIATEFVDRMGFTDADGPKSCRWVAIRHGQSKNGNDHVHIAVNLVREDGTKADVHRDFPRAQKIAGELEKKYGLNVLESRALDQRTLSANKPAELARAGREGEEYTQRDELRRRLRAAATGAASETDFIAAAKRSRVLVRPRCAKADLNTVVGYSAALIPSTNATEPSKPIWYAPSKLDRSLGLTQLRASWDNAPTAERDAVDAWKGAARAIRTQQFDAPNSVKTAALPNVARARLDAHESAQTTTPTGAAQSIAAEAAAADIAGAYAHASMALEKGKPGPLAAASDEYARAAQGTRGAPVPGRISDLAYQARLMERGAGRDQMTGWIAVMRQLDRLGKTIARVQEERGARVHAESLRATSSAALAAVQERTRTAQQAQPVTASRTPHLKTTQSRDRGPELG